MNRREFLILMGISLTANLLAENSEKEKQGYYDIHTKILNKEPEAKGIVGWECTKSGTPGNWKEIPLKT